MTNEQHAQIDELRKAAFVLTPAAQFRLASFIAENVGYVLGPDPLRGGPDESGGRAQSPWQPIEKAPKDGTRFIGGFWSIRWADSHRKGDIVRCWYQPEFEAFISGCREMQTHNGYTFEDGSTRQLHSPVIEPITEWMPLPAYTVPSTDGNTATSAVSE